MQKKHDVCKFRHDCSSGICLISGKKIFLKTEKLFLVEKLKNDIKRGGGGDNILNSLSFLGSPLYRVAISWKILENPWKFWKKRLVLESPGKTCIIWLSPGKSWKKQIPERLIIIDFKFWSLSLTTLEEIISDVFSGLITFLMSLVKYFLNIFLYSLFYFHDESWTVVTWIL